jgi:hypothetical protein
LEQLLRKPCWPKGYHGWPACLWLLGGLQPPSNSIHVGFAEGVKKGLGGLVVLQCLQKIFGNDHVFGRIIGGFPPAILLGRFNLGQASWLHPPFGSQLSYFRDVPFRP